MGLCGSCVRATECPRDDGVEATQRSGSSGARGRYTVQGMLPHRFEGYPWSGVSPYVAAVFGIKP